ncbi:MAG: hypothetical protein SOX69_07710 [Oscillospiraceae bacterium]|nr:hypothetical protein [Oscillospiraceae bacterium]
MNYTCYEKKSDNEQILSSTQDVGNECIEPTTKQKKKTVKKLIIIGLLLLVVLSVGVLVYNSSPIQEYVTAREEIKKEKKASEKAIQEAVSAENNNDYELAIKKYKEVIPEDKSYEAAQNKISALLEKYVSQVIDSAKNLSEKKQYEDALTAIENAANIAGETNELTALKKQIQNSYTNYLTEEAKRYADDKQYDSAVSFINKAISISGKTDELIAVKEQYEELKKFKYAKVQVVNKKKIEKDIYNSRYSNYAEFIFEVTNTSDKPIKGIEGVLTVYDLFGKEIKKFGCDFTGKTIAVGETATYDNMSIEINEFIDEDVEIYLTDFSDMQFSYEFISIVYSDGSKITP